MSDCPEPSLLLRLFSRSGTLTQARQVENDLLQQLAAFSPRPCHPPEAYWKDPGCFELALTLLPATRESFRQVAGLLASGRRPDWQCGFDEAEPEELDAVWNAPNAGGHAIFGLPSLYWAQLCWCGER